MSKIEKFDSALAKKAGVTQVNLDLLAPEKVGLVEAYGTQVIPALRASS